MKINFLEIFYGPQIKKQRQVYYGGILLLSLLVALFCSPNEQFLKIILSTVILITLLTSGLRLSINQWTLLSVLAMSVFILNSLFFGQSLFLYIAILALCALSIFYQPKTGIYIIILATIWFERHFTLQSLVIGQSVYKIYPLDFIIIFTSLSVLYRIIKDKWRWQWGKLDKPILLFGAICTFGYMYGIAKTGVSDYFAFGTYKNYFLYAIIYALMGFLFKTRKDWKELMIWFSVGGLGLFYFMFYGIINGHGLWSEYTPLSTSGERLIAGTHVFYMLMFGFWLLALYLWPKLEKVRYPRKIVPWFLGLVSLALLISLVRHLWLAIAGVAVVWMIFLLRQQKIKFVSLFLKGLFVSTVAILAYAWIIGLATSQAPPILNQVWHVLTERASVETIMSLEDSSAHYRILAWKAGLQAWQENPLLGTGLGQTITGMKEDASYIFTIAAKEMHNNYLSMLVQMGLLGILVLFYWFWIIIKEILGLWKKLKFKHNFDTALFFCWGSTVLLFMLVFVISVYWDVNLFVIWWWLAVSAISYLLKQRSI
ncbi:MAG: O-antigen ligase family protein [bacterium]